jgi:phage baseplate assembly protein W
MMERASYGSDLTREQYEAIRPMLEQALKKSGERRAVRAWTARKDKLLHR